MLRPCSKRCFARQPQARWRGGYSSLRRHCTRLICSTSKLRRSFAAMLRTARSMSNAAAWLLLTSPTFLYTDTRTISLCRGSGICGTTSRPMTPCTSPSLKRSMLRYSPAINVSRLRPAIMRGSSWCEAFRPQSRRGSADVLTINRPDARIGKLLAMKKQKKAKQPGPVSVTEKTKRLSGVSRGHLGSPGKRDAHPDRSSHDRCGDFAVHADHGGRHEVRRD